MLMNVNLGKIYAALHGYKCFNLIDIDCVLRVKIWVKLDECSPTAALKCTPAECTVGKGIFLMHNNHYV